MSAQDFKPEFPGQHEGETIAHVFRTHPVVLRKKLIIGLLILVVSEIPLLLFPDYFDITTKILLGGLVAAILYMAYYWMGWYYSIYILTDSRLINIRQMGFFSREVNEINIAKIQSVNYRTRGVQAALFKFGDINIQTSSGTEWKLNSIHHPVTVHEHIMRAVRDAGQNVSTGKGK